MLRYTLQRLSRQSAAAGDLLMAVQQQSAHCSSIWGALCSTSVAGQQLHSISDASSAQTAQQHSTFLQQHTYSTLVGTEQQPTHKQKQLRDKQQQQQQLFHPYSWNGLSPKIASRKPAIKRPARHQWYYCSPDYDPMEDRPEQPLPPYAPARAHAKDYRALFFANKPKHHRNRYRRMWAKNMAIADQRWRQNWERHLAAKRKEEEKLQRLTDRIIRQRSWEAWKAEQALLAASQQSS